MIEPLLLTTCRVATFDGNVPLTGASGFFFERDGRLFLVTSRHVMIDEPSGHLPNRIEIELHTDATDLTRSIGFSMLLYRDCRSVWRQGGDSGGGIDVAVIELDRAALPPVVLLRSFTPANLQRSLQEVEVGTSLLIVGFPLGFHDARHHLPVVRQAVIASAFGVRFQGLGYFLTDARTHRGTRGQVAGRLRLLASLFQNDDGWRSRTERRALLGIGRTCRFVPSDARHSFRRVEDRRSAA